MSYERRLLGALLIFGMMPAINCFGQLENSYGKAWKRGTPKSDTFIQMVADNVYWDSNETEGEISGKFSVKRNGEWVLPHVKNFSGTVTKDGDFVRFDCACTDGVKFRGWYSKGERPFDRSDDKIMIYMFNVASATDTDPCNPDDDILEEENLLDVP